jgi:hypothetical protein
MRANWLAPVLGFEPLPATFLRFLVAVSATYLAVVELERRRSGTSDAIEDSHADAINVSVHDAASVDHPQGRQDVAGP